MASTEVQPAAGTEGVLLERGGELAFAAECLDAVAQSGRGRVVLVGGEAGGGKTVLLRRICDEHVAEARVLWGACDPLFTPRPLGPLLAVAEASGPALERALEQGTPYEVVRELEQELRLRPPTVFVLEDLHWADEATLDVLRLLARRVESVPALVLASYRDDELERTHPLRLVLGELATGAPVRRLKLAPLSRSGVAALAEPRGVDPDALWRKTGGNPFFVVEALDAGADEIPATVRDAVLARAARLGGGAKALLDAVAIVPPRAGIGLLDALAEGAVARLDECLASGMLVHEGEAVAFRHELARLTVEESIPLNVKVELHRRALAYLSDAPGGTRDLARLAHHAEAAGDVEAVLLFAPAAAERAAAAGAYREAAAQYERALRYGDRVAPDVRAELLERRSHACYLTDESDASIESIEGALALRRELGQTLEEGEALRWYSQILWCPGRTAESQRAAREAVALLETLPPSRELATAYGSLAEACAAASQAEEGLTWARRAVALADELGDEEIALSAATTLGGLELGYFDGSPATLERNLERAHRAGLPEQVARAYITIVAASVDTYRFAHAARYVQAGIDYCSDRGLELFRLYLLAFRARLELAEGRWDDAADTASAVLRVHRTSITPSVMSLVALALVRARRGDPGCAGLLEEAWALAEPSGEPARLGPVAAARAEVGWLEGDPAAVAAATEVALPLAVERGRPQLADELVAWRRRAGLDREPIEGWRAAAERWRELNCPYAAALALGDADEEEPLRAALDALQELGARPAAAIVGRKLRDLGARGLPRGPRPATQRNPAGLTPREVEVLALVAGGLRNAEIASRLVLSQRTVGHHVGAILRKLEVDTRAQAGAEAVRLGLVAEDR